MRARDARRRARIIFRQRTLRKYHLFWKSLKDALLSPGHTMPSLSDIELHEIIGRGGFGVVYRGTCVGSGESLVDVAVKQMDLAALRRRDPNCEKTLMREITVMQELEHPNILRLLDWKRETDQISMALELLRGPEIKQVVDARGALDEPDASAMLRQIIGALCHMHEREIVHRDLKSENVMLVAPLADLRLSPLRGCVVKLLDFGLAREVRESPRPAQKGSAKKTGKSIASLRKLGSQLAISKSQSKSGESSASAASDDKTAPSPPKKTLRHSMSCVGTVGFAPPEITQPADHSGHVTMDFDHAMLIDAYAVGEMMRHMITGVSPEKTIMQGLEEQGIDCGCFQLGKVVRIVDPLRVSDLASELMRGLTHPKADRRMSLRVAREHPWLTETSSSESESEGLGAARI